MEYPYDFFYHFGKEQTFLCACLYVGWKSSDMNSDPNLVVCFDESNKDRLTEIEFGQPSLNVISQMFNLLLMRITTGVLLNCCNI
jgi:hypothetical protein